MKKNIKYAVVFTCVILTVYSCILMAMFEYDPVGDIINWKFMTSLPLQTGCCEIIGVGCVTNHWANGKGIDIAVDNYWRGNPGSNTLSISVSTNQPPVSDTPLVFFMTSYGSYRNGIGLNLGLYSYIFNEEKRNERDWAEELELFDSERSWFHVTDTNLLSFASNLVFATDSNNTNLFYETIRDGFRLAPDDSRIKEDSFLGFLFSGRYMTTNFINQIWGDPLLIGAPKNTIYNWYQSETGIWLPKY